MCVYIQTYIYYDICICVNINIYTHMYITHTDTDTDTDTDTHTHTRHPLSLLYHLFSGSQSYFFLSFFLAFNVYKHPT